MNITKKIWGIISIILLVLFDQLTKLLAVAKLKDHEPFEIIKNVFELQYLENRGAAFGILQGKKIFFVIITLLIIGIFLYIYFKLPETKHFLWMRITVIFLLSGAVGNFIDRVWRNYVVDFFYFKLIDFAIFNVADIYVSVAAVLLIILILFVYKDEDYKEVFHR